MRGIEIGTKLIFVKHADELFHAIVQIIGYGKTGPKVHVTKILTKDNLLALEGKEEIEVDINEIYTHRTESNEVCSRGLYKGMRYIVVMDNAGKKYIELPPSNMELFKAYGWDLTILDDIGNKDPWKVIDLLLTSRN